MRPKCDPEMHGEHEGISRRLQHYIRRGLIAPDPRAEEGIKDTLSHRQPRALKRVASQSPSQRKGAFPRPANCESGIPLHHEGNHPSSSSGVGAGAGVTSGAGGSSGVTLHTSEVQWNKQQLFPPKVSRQTLKGSA